ncbi:hypothetical protein MP228_005644 [Amoeboaphelidium protococcarum]|nr:hypothetical protein MP228_005644 [Amoeboaphelidium protococcarum]
MEFEIDDDLLLCALDNIENVVDTGPNISTTNLMDNHQLWQGQQTTAASSSSSCIVKSSTSNTKIRENKQTTLFDNNFSLKHVPDSNNNIANFSRPSSTIASLRVNTQNFSVETHHEIDQDAVKTWIYPNNYPVRQYQFSIIKKALFVNTLVCLPTGLGKTFIAAVLMFNYYRWFPKSKIFFLAPTKPLVAQQIKACYQITGIPQADTVELTGAMQPATRAKMYQERRVFFMTPQSLSNDLNSGICDPRQIVCLVIDEAHRATGNYAYCQVIEKVYQSHKAFRILALSATPGSLVDSVQVIVNNCKIHQIEIRTEESKDIVQYIYNKRKDVVVVKLSPDICKVRDTFSQQILQPAVSRLFRAGAIYQKDAMNVGKYQILMARQRFNMNGNRGNDRYKNLIRRDFTALMTLYHAFELLPKHGVLSFYKYLKEVLADSGGPKSTSGPAKLMLMNNPLFRGLMNFMEEITSRPTFVGHPKLDVLESRMLQHFMDSQYSSSDSQSSSDQQSSVSTRAMVFCEYRDAVDEIVARLNKHQPTIKAVSFIGQSSNKSVKGYTQKQQLEVIKKFQNGEYNVIVATCIGEEGLDIGEVDLIVCYDTQSSPVRMLQRMGRTGRKRDGSILVLLSEGKEEYQYKETQNSYKKVQQAIMSQDKCFTMWPQECRVLPSAVSQPVCSEQLLSFAQYDDNFANQKPPSDKKQQSKAKSKKVAVNEDAIPLEQSVVKVKDVKSNTNTGKKSKATKQSSKEKSSVPTPDLTETAATNTTRQKVQFVNLISDDDEDEDFAKGDQKVIESGVGVKIVSAEPVPLVPKVVQDIVSAAKQCQEIILKGPAIVKDFSSVYYALPQHEIGSNCRNQVSCPTGVQSDLNLALENAVIGISYARTDSLIVIPKKSQSYEGNSMVSVRQSEHQTAQDFNASPDIRQSHLRTKPKETRKSTAKRNFVFDEADLTDAENTDEEVNYGSRKRVRNTSEDEDEDKLDEMLAQDLELVNFVVEDHDQSEVSAQEQSHPGVFSHHHGQYRMKFNDDISLSQKYVHQKPVLKEGASDYDLGSFVVGDDDDDDDIIDIVDDDTSGEIVDVHDLFESPQIPRHKAINNKVNQKKRRIISSSVANTPMSGKISISNSMISQKVWI